MEEEKSQGYSVMQLALVVNDIRLRAVRLNFKVEFTGDAIVFVSEVNVVMHTLDQAMSFLEGIEYAMDYLIEPAKGEDEDE